MESVIIDEMRAFLRLDLPDRQRQYFTDTIAVAKRVEVVKAADVFDEREIELIRRTVRPVVKECYKNAHLLTLLFPDRVQYVKGKTNVFIPIDHAFNRVGNKYIDITFEFALGLDPTQYEYVAFGEYPAGVIEEITDHGILWRYIPILLLCGANGVGKDEPPDVTDTPGVRYAVTESDFW